MTEVRHVVHVTGGGWIVVHDANGQPAHDNGNGNADAHRRHFERKREAAAHAKNLVREQGGGEVRLHAPSGRIMEVDTVTPDESTASRT